MQLIRNLCLLGSLPIKHYCFGKSAESCRPIVFLKLDRSLSSTKSSCRTNEMLKKLLGCHLSDDVLFQVVWFKLIMFSLLPSLKSFVSYFYCYFKVSTQ